MHPPTHTLTHQHTTVPLLLLLACQVILHYAYSYMSDVSGKAHRSCPDAYLEAARRGDRAKVSAAGSWRMAACWLGRLAAACAERYFLLAAAACVHPRPVLPRPATWPVHHLHMPTLAPCHPSPLTGHHPPPSFLTP